MQRGDVKNAAATIKTRRPRRTVCPPQHVILAVSNLSVLVWYRSVSWFFVTACCRRVLEPRVGCCCNPAKVRHYLDSISLWSMAFRPAFGNPSVKRKIGKLDNPRLCCCVVTNNDEIGLNDRICLPGVCLRTARASGEESSRTVRNSYGSERMIARASCGDGWSIRHG